MVVLALYKLAYFSIDYYYSHIGKKSVQAVLNLTNAQHCIRKKTVQSKNIKAKEFASLI